jgi:hypothetical protein
MSADQKSASTAKVKRLCLPILIASFPSPKMLAAALARHAPRRVLGSRTLAQLPNSNLPSLDFSPEVQEEQTTGAKSSKDSLSSVEIKRRRLGRISLAVLVLGFGINAVYMGREWDESELKAKKLVSLSVGVTHLCSHAARPLKTHRRRVSDGQKNASLICLT